MSSSSARGYDDLTVEEAELALKTARRRFAGMFNRATHPRWRTQKGTHRCTRGMVFSRTGDKQWLIEHATREIKSGDGLPGNVVIKRAVIRRVVTEMLISGDIKYQRGAWMINEAVMVRHCMESARLSNEAREHRRKDRESSRKPAPSRRVRRSMPATA